MPDTPFFSIGGLASGLDTTAIVEGLTRLERRPLESLRTQQTGFRTQISLIGSLVSQFGAYLGGHFATPVPLNIAIVVLSIGCASTMIFLVPRRNVVVSEELIEQAEEEESGLL